MITRLIPLALVLAIALSGGVAMAQDECDRPSVDVEYQEVVLEVSPCDGVVQQLVIQKTTIESLTDDPTATVRLITLISNGDTYEVYPTVFSVERSGLYAGAEVGDTFVVGKKAE